MPAMTSAAELWATARCGEWRGTTAGHCPAYQGHLRCTWVAPTIAMGYNLYRGLGFRGYCQFSVNSWAGGARLASGGACGLT
jgi:hypothetical protein